MGYGVWGEGGKLCRFFVFVGGIGTYDANV